MKATRVLYHSDQVYLWFRWHYRRTANNDAVHFLVEQLALSKRGKPSNETNPQSLAKLVKMVMNNDRMYTTIKRARHGAKCTTEHRHRLIIYVVTGIKTCVPPGSTMLFTLSASAPAVQSRPLVLCDVSPRGPSACSWLGSCTIPAVSAALL